MYLAPFIGIVAAALVTIILTITAPSWKKALIKLISKAKDKIKN